MESPLFRTPQLRFRGFTDPWEQRKVGDLGEVITGSTPATSHPEYYSKDGISWVTPTDINENVTYDTPRKLSEEGQKVGRVVPKNTILVTCIASIGKNTILGNMGSFNQQINGLVPDFENYDPYFLFTESAKWSQVMKRQAAAGTMQIVNKTEFSNIETTVPNFDEQKKIGSFFSNLDNLITLHQRKHEKLINIKKSMLEKIFPQNGSVFPEIRFAGFTAPWERCKLGELFDFRYGDGNNNPSNGGKYPVYGAGGIQGKYTAYNAENSVIIGHMGDAGCVSWGEGKHFVTYNGTITKPKNKVFPAKFGYYLLLQMNLRKYRMGSGLPFLTYEMLTELETLNSVSANECNAIAGVFSKLDYAITLQEHRLEKLDQLKKSMLEKLFV